MIDLGKKAIYETSQLDNSIQESINNDLSKIYKYQVNHKLEMRIRDELNRINADLKVINSDVLKNIEILVESKRQLILNRINNTLETTLNEIRGWKRLDQRRAKKLMEDRLNELKTASSEELKIAKVEIFKLTKLKIESILRKIRILFDKLSVKMQKYLN